jgi:hexosaminidase
MISRDVVVISWENHYQKTTDLLEGGFKIINFTWQPNYIIPSITHNDWNVKSVLDWNVYEWQHWWPKSEAFLNPITVQPTDQVLGATLCSWEQTYEQEINTVMENLAAVSERTWNVQRKVSDEAYTEMYQSQRLRLARLIQDR